MCITLSVACMFKYIPIYVVFLSKNQVIHFILIQRYFFSLNISWTVVASSFYTWYLLIITLCVQVVSLLRLFCFCCLHIANWPAAVRDVALPSHCPLVPIGPFLAYQRKLPGFLWNLTLLVRLLRKIHRNENQNQEHLKVRRLAMLYQSLGTWTVSSC